MQKMVNMTKSMSLEKTFPCQSIPAQQKSFLETSNAEDKALTMLVSWKRKKKAEEPPASAATALQAPSFLSWQALSWDHSLQFLDIQF